jgi:uncharacterized protein with HEPN domain
MYSTDLKTKHAVERNFSIIGEAVARIDKSFKETHPSVDWREVKDFRNIIVHAMAYLRPEVAALNTLQKFPPPTLAISSSTNPTFSIDSTTAK